MNKYRVWYSYTKPTCECPEVLVVDDKLYVDIESTSHKEQFCNAEARINKEFDRLQMLVKITRNKTKCKCIHCERFTPIASHS